MRLFGLGEERKDESNVKAAPPAGVTTDHIYDASGSVVAEIQGTTWTKGYAYAGGKMVAQYNGALNASGATTLFAHADHLGSTRVMTTVAASMQECDDYLPYGELLPCGGTSTTTHKFTGRERDGESNLDSFPARYFESISGRWMSPDWSPKPTTVPYAKLGDPQTLNLYSYLRNNPLNAVDHDGHTSDPCKDNPTSCTVTVNEKDKTATITQTTSTTVISKDKDGNEISTSTTTTTSLTVSTADKTNGQILGGSTTVTTAVSNLTLLTEGTTKTTMTSTLNPEQANKAIGADKVEKLQSFVNTSPSHRLATHPVTAGGIVVGAGGGIACAIAEPCGAIAVVASLLGGGAALFGLAYDK